MISAFLPVGVPGSRSALPFLAFGHKSFKPTQFQKSLNRIFTGNSKKLNWLSTFRYYNTSKPLPRDNCMSYYKPLKSVLDAHYLARRPRIKVFADNNHFHFYSTGTRTKHEIDVGIAMAHFEIVNYTLDQQGYWQNTIQNEGIHFKYIKTWTYNKEA